MFVSWILLSVALEIVLPGEVVEGNVLPNNSESNSKSSIRLKYKMSGHLQFWISLLIMFHSLPKISIIGGDTIYSQVISFKGFHPIYPIERLYDQYLPLITASVIFSFLLSTYLYISSFALDLNGQKRLLAKGGNTGNAVYDFFIGRELNPRILWGSFDLKEFCELKPGLIGWFMLNIGMAAKQYSKRGGSISLSMVSVVLLQGIYVWDALYNEKAILTTMDITTDGFGFMLCFGDLAWVPFIYSLQARYLVDHDPELSVVAIVAILAVQCLGYYIFRSANSQKDAFRRDPSSSEVAHLTYLQTSRGTRLLTSGWWGMARKINYTGDWLITLSWCLLCGFHSPIPYFQAIYFLVLLIHRAIRDDGMCHEKYGDDWLEYKRRVPYLFIPYVI
eukprot:CAMPEP_0170083680 /NCGR_PEP_ID=MMETSP0019_2-20121128/19054_1 /TAXON_ID=98059 /ORGANISM="Dinobryon sp., Strain UTEXLB2267" /LENGTH=390 /DNA_ID=CAMNT_0010299365 /DNA_START=228 /DNA_END=1400 /DNA_ORIENTATION=+